MRTLERIWDGIQDAWEWLYNTISPSLVPLLLGSVFLTVVVVIAILITE